MSVCENIAKLCKAKNMSLAELERAVGLGNGVIGKWGVSSPRVENIKRVADFLGCTVDDLLKEDSQQ